MGLAYLKGCLIRASGSVLRGSPGAWPRIEFSSFKAPQPNSSTPLGWMLWNCQWRSPQTVKKPLDLPHRIAPQ